MLTLYSYQVDFTKVATECHVVSRGAAYVIYIYITLQLDSTPRVFRLQLYNLTNVNITK